MEDNFVVCPYCGHINSKRGVSYYGTCNACKKVLDEKLKFRYDMNKVLKLWRYDRNYARVSKYNINTEWSHK